MVFKNSIYIRFVKQNTTLKRAKFNRVTPTGAEIIEGHGRKFRTLKRLACMRGDIARGPRD